jgi:hypothetical protein
MDAEALQARVEEMERENQALEQRIQAGVPLAPADGDQIMA